MFYVYLFNNESIEKSLNLALESSLNICGCCSCSSCCLNSVVAAPGARAAAVGSIFSSLLRGLRKNFVFI